MQITRSEACRQVTNAGCLGGGATKWRNDLAQRFGEGIAGAKTVRMIKRDASSQISQRGPIQVLVKLHPQIATADLNFVHRARRHVRELFDFVFVEIHQRDEALPADPQIGPYLKHLADDTMPRDDDVAEYLKPFSLHKDGLVLRDGLVYVPDEGNIKLEILKSCHDSKISGHLGQAKTLEIVSRNYFWPRMRQYINEYVQTCDTCARNKTPRHAPYGQLHPLPIPAGPWESVSMDYIVELPMSNGHDAIYVCVDRLTKMAHFCPTTSSVTTEQTAQLYLQKCF